MATKHDLQELLDAYEPVLDREFDVKDATKGLRDLATKKGIDWSAFKAVAKARKQDERDAEEGKEGGRLDKIIERADFAQAYANMLGFTEDEREKENRSSEPQTSNVTPIVPSDSRNDGGMPPIPDEFRRRKASA